MPLRHNCICSFDFFFLFQGQYFSGNNHRIYLLGNPIIWWTNLVFLAIFFWTLIIDAVRRQRSSSSSTDESSSSNNCDRTLTAGLWLLLGWL